MRGRAVSHSPKNIKTQSVAGFCIAFEEFVSSCRAHRLPDRTIIEHVKGQCHHTLKADQQLVGILISLHLIYQWSGRVKQQCDNCYDLPIDCRCSRWYYYVWGVGVERVQMTQCKNYTLYSTFNPNVISVKSFLTSLIFTVKLAWEVIST